MTKATIYATRRAAVERGYAKLLARHNEPVLPGNGIFTRYKYPILTAEHAPLTWRYDFNPATNPFFMERLGINVAFNAGAIKLDGEYILIVRTEGWDRKSFFALARSKDGIQNWTFDPEPILTPETSNPDTNLYDTRLTAHEDGWIYGIFCSERKDPMLPRAIPPAPWPPPASCAPRTSRTGSACRIWLPRVPNSAMWCCIQNS